MADMKYRLNPDPPFLMQPYGCKYTPEEVGRMLGNRVVQPHYAEYLVRRAISFAMQSSSEGGREERQVDSSRYEWLRSGGFFQCAGRIGASGVTGAEFDSVIDHEISRGNDED